MLLTPDWPVGGISGTLSRKVPSELILFPHHVLPPGIFPTLSASCCTPQAYSVHDVEVGYCQGMSFIAGILLVHLPEEEQSFHLFLNLLHRYELRDNYKPDLSGNDGDSSTHPTTDYRPSANQLH